MSGLTAGGPIFLSSTGRAQPANNARSGSAASDRAVSRLPACLFTRFFRNLLEKVFCGTELNIVQEGLPDSIPPRLAISGGRNRSRSLRNSSKPRFQRSEVTYAH